MGGYPRVLRRVRQLAAATPLKVSIALGEVGGDDTFCMPVECLQITAGLADQQRPKHFAGIRRASQRFAAKKR